MNRRLQGARIIATTAQAAECGEARLLCPAFAGLGARVADIAATLPLADANGSLLRELERRVHERDAPGGLYAGVLAVDPFWRTEDLVQELRALGVNGVTNLPTLGVLDGDYRDAMASMGFSFEAELDFLAVAARSGLHPVAFVRSLTQAEAAVARGIATLALHPGLPHGQNPMDRQLAAACATAVRRARETLPEYVELLVFRHPDFADTLDGAVAEADGEVTYAVDCVEETRAG